MRAISIGKWVGFLLGSVLAWGQVPASAPATNPPRGTDAAEQTREPGTIPDLKRDQFARLVQVLGEEMRATVEQHDVPRDSLCRVLVNASQQKGELERARRFAADLTDGLRPQLMERLRLTDSSTADSRLIATLNFLGAPAGSTVGRLQFALNDAWRDSALLSLEFDYSVAAPESRPVRPPPTIVVETGSPDERRVTVRDGREDDSDHKRLKMDLSAQDLADRIRAGTRAYSDQTVFTPTGRLIFLNDDDVRRFWIMSVQAERHEAERLRVQVAIRARGERRKAHLRVVYLDGAGRPIAVSSVHTLRCPQSETVTAVFQAADPRAAGYVCLFDGD